MIKTINYIRESFFELTERVTWPSWEELIEGAIVVVIVCLVLSVLIFGVDLAFEKGLEFIYSSF